MSNGSVPNPATNLQDWAIYHEASTAEKWHSQEGKNHRTDAWMLSQERRIQKLENRGAVVVGVAVVLGSLVASIVPAIITKLLG